MQLRVVVRVDVDEARRDGQTVRVDHLGRIDVPSETSDLGDATVTHRDVGREPGSGGSVDDGAAADQQIDLHRREMP